MPSSLVDSDNSVVAGPLVTGSMVADSVVVSGSEPSGSTMLTVSVWDGF